MLPFEDHFLCLASLLRCEEQKSLPGLEKIENCFRLSFLFWMDMDRKIRAIPWNEQDRIFVSKQVNPLYVSTIEYYKLLYHAALFQPPEKSALPDFWRREFRRNENFQRQHGEFYGYFKSGGSDRDDYFYSNPHNLPPLNIRHGKTKYLANGDLLLAQLKALERYDQYVQFQMALHLADQ